MKRYHFSYGREENDLDDNGPHVMYEEAHEIEIDRDMKSANLKTLVDMVLAFTAVASIDPESEAQFCAMADLARGLKQ
jgi:hypothetical protein